MWRLNMPRSLGAHLLGFGRGITSADRVVAFEKGALQGFYPQNFPVVCTMEGETSTIFKS